METRGERRERGERGESPEERRRSRDEAFADSVGRKEAWRSTREREKDRTLLFGLGMFGLVGWSVAIPTLVGTALGAWIDREWSSSYSWTLMLLLGGVVAGCMNAWHWVQRAEERMKGGPGTP